MPMSVGSRTGSREIPAVLDHAERRYRPSSAPFDRGLSGPRSPPAHSSATAGRSDAMTIDVRHIRILLALAEEKNFTRAAARVGIPQPAMSTQLRRIERALGMRLFSRTTRSVTLTEEGERLLPHLVAVNRSLRRIEDAARTRSFAARRVRIGLMMPQATGVTKQLRLEYPE